MYQPVVSMHTQDLMFSQYLALLTVVDVFCVMSLREALRLCFQEGYRPFSVRWVDFLFSGMA